MSKKGNFNSLVIWTGGQGRFRRKIRSAFVHPATGVNQFTDVIRLWSDHMLTAASH